jgi:outer membrane protein assembly factor BamB
MPSYKSKASARPERRAKRTAGTLTPRIIALDGEKDPRHLKIECVPSRTPHLSLGDLPNGVRLEGPERIPLTLLILPISPKDTIGIDPATVRLFRLDDRGRRFTPVWNSGFNFALGQLWAKVDRAGDYFAVGLPRDRFLGELLRQLAVERRLNGSSNEGDARALTWRILNPILEFPPEEIDELREFLTRIELQTSPRNLKPSDLTMREGGHISALALPGGVSLQDLRKRIVSLRPSPEGLPEEVLFYPPEALREGLPPWDILPRDLPWRGIDHRLWEPLKFHLRLNICTILPWLCSQDWWMYQHDSRHTGHASGASDIRSTTVSALYALPPVSVDGPVISKPCIVDGKIYVGTGRQGGPGGTLYRINLATGAVEATRSTTGIAFYSWYQGIGGSPAITGGRIYFTGVHGKVYCIDATTFAPIWETDLKVANSGQNQPVNNPNADCWSGPLVVNGRVYVGCGEGESSSTCGFVFCLNAVDGHVLWLFCTCKFSGPGDNQPNTVPTAVAASWAASAGFTVVSNPVETGCSVWSSCAYDSVLNRIYVGTGNSQYPHTSEPDELYGSGLLSLDAVTGQFRGFFQPTADDSYRPDDSDVDVPGSATVFTRSGQRVVAFGSKNGSFFLLDANTLAPLARRQLLPRIGGTGIPGNRGAPISSIDPVGRPWNENKWGVMGTPALHSGLGRLFVGLGGYDGMNLDAGAGIDPTRSPFLRAVDWNTLLDAWPTTLGADNVSRYSAAKPPLYTSLEVGLSSPAVVNDVVFVSTNKTGLYALDAGDGHCLWAATNLPSGAFALGPAIFGNYVVLGAGDKIYIYKLGRSWVRPSWWNDIMLVQGWQPPFPWPPPIVPPIPWPPPPPGPNPGPDPQPY